MRIVDDIAVFSQEEREQARDNAGHGCIRCGCTIYRYCLAEGAGAQSGILLFCPPCLVVLSAATDLAKVLAVLREFPLPRQRNFDRRPHPYMEAFDIPDTRFASGAAMHRTVFPIVFGGEPVVSIEPPEINSGPIQLTVTLGDAGGNLVTIVKKNEWSPPDDGWKFDRRPGRYIFASADGEAMLVLAFPGNGSLVIESLRSRFEQQLLELDAGGGRLDGAAVIVPSVDSRLVGMRI